MALQMFGFHMCTAHQTQNRTGPLGGRRPSTRHLLPTPRAVKTNLSEFWELRLFSGCCRARSSASAFSRLLPWPGGALTGVSAPFLQLEVNRGWRAPGDALAPVHQFTRLY